MALAWKKHDPEASTFNLAVGDATEYVVYTLTVASAEEADVRAAVHESVAQMCRLAADNLAGTDFVLFEWDVVYATLTVVFTARGRSKDGRDVLKVFAEGWDSRLHADRSEEEAERIDEQHAERVRAWIREGLRAPAARETLALLSKHGVAPAFTASHHATTFETL